MKKLSLLAVLIGLALSCQREALIEENEIMSPSPLKGHIEQMEGETKTYLDENYSIVWSGQDEVLVFQGSTLGKKYRVSAASAGKTAVDFDYIESVNSGLSGGSEIPNIVAYYPFDASVDCRNGDNSQQGSSYKLNVTLPSIQAYADNSFGPNANPMVAVTQSVSDTDLNFRNICGGLRLQIKGSGMISKILVEGNNSEVLSGDCQITSYAEGNAPVVAFNNTADGRGVTLFAEGNGISLDSQSAKSFFIAVPPTVFSKGFKVTLINSYGQSKVISTSSACQIKRSVIMTMPEITFNTSTVGDGGDLSAYGTANSYIVSQAGSYKFKTVKGNSHESVGTVVTAQVLWETFGTNVTPNVGDLVRNVRYNNGYIGFDTNPSFKEGNAVIAAKDATGKILWSWHIWLTDQPEDQVYYNNAGTMMDRNLGATSATPGDVGALGLLYQWGRKDPFLGGSAISYSSSSNQAKAASTLTWPEAVTSDATIGTIAYAQEHPTTFIKYNSSNNDWYYTGSSSTDNTRWRSTKTIYDPCPPGYRVPDGGSNGVWSKALGSSSSFTNKTLYNSTTRGFNFYGKFGDASTIWYPLSGYLNYSSGQLYNVGSDGLCWSIPPSSSNAYSLYLSSNGSVSPSYGNGRARGRSVRCCKQRPSDVLQGQIDLSSNGTANSYIVSQPGSYAIRTVKGNSEESVGDVASVEVLWESFGTDTAPSVGDLVTNANILGSYITFEATDKKGNALIAVKDASGKILWSWHIWMTDKPADQEYYNNAGTMMDRNLGATSATPGDVGALGLLYQWGRKDPFLGGSAISYSSSSNQAKAASTLTWPEAVTSDATIGTIAYAQEHPTTFIKYNSSNNDWYYTGSSSTDNTLWQSTKTIYDPCPPGYRVPDGGGNGIWSKALGSSSYFTDQTLYNSTTRGYNLSDKFGDASTIWYPLSGYLYGSSGQLSNVGSSGSYWSITPSSGSAYDLYLRNDGGVGPSSGSNRAGGRSVRCLQE